MSPTALEDAKQLVLNAFDENSDGRIDIAEVNMEKKRKYWKRFYFYYISGEIHWSQLLFYDDNMSHNRSI